MANHKSAKKRIRQTEKKRTRNKLYKSSVRTAIKNALKAVEAKKSGEEVEKDPRDLMAFAEKKIQSAVSKGIIKKKTASRKISRLYATLP